VRAFHGIRVPSLREISLYSKEPFLFQSWVEYSDDGRCLTEIGRDDLPDPDYIPKFITNADTSHFWYQFYLVTYSRNGTVIKVFHADFDENYFNCGAFHIPYRTWHKKKRVKSKRKAQQVFKQIKHLL